MPAPLQPSYYPLPSHDTAFLARIAKVNYACAKA